MPTMINDSISKIVDSERLLAFMKVLARRTGWTLESILASP